MIAAVDSESSTVEILPYHFQPETAASPPKNRCEMTIFHKSSGYVVSARFHFDFASQT